jgi:hypothetical protein
MRPGCSASWPHQTQVHRGRLQRLSGGNLKREARERWRQKAELSASFCPREQASRDDKALDLIGAFADHHERRVPVVPLDR